MFQFLFQLLFFLASFSQLFVVFWLKYSTNNKRLSSRLLLDSTNRSRRLRVVNFSGWFTNMNEEQILSFRSKLKVRWYRFDTSGWMTSSTWVYHSWSLALPRLSSTWNITHTHTHTPRCEWVIFWQTDALFRPSVQIGARAGWSVSLGSAEASGRVSFFPRKPHKKRSFNDGAAGSWEPGVWIQEGDAPCWHAVAWTAFQHPWFMKNRFFKNGSIDLQCDIRKAHLTEVGSVLSAACRGPGPLL